MSRLSLRAAWLRILCDRRASQKSRLEALARIERPGKSLLRSLLADDKLPPVLRYEVTKAYEVSEAETELKCKEPVLEPVQTKDREVSRKPLTPEQIKDLLG
jgi:hypothetical protein